LTNQENLQTIYIEMTHISRFFHLIGQRGRLQGSLLPFPARYAPFLWYLIDTQTSRILLNSILFAAVVLGRRKCASSIRLTLAGIFCLRRGCTLALPAFLIRSSSSSRTRDEASPRFHVLLNNFLNCY